MRFDGVAPAWRSRLGLGPVTHGLELLGARTPEELTRMGWDVVWSDAMPADADPICDVTTARVFFPRPPAPPVRLRVDAQPARDTLAELDWSVRWPMFLAAQRRGGRIEVRRQANAARARLGLLSADIEDNVEAAGGTVYGAHAWTRGSLVPAFVGDAGDAKVRRWLGRQAQARLEQACRPVGI